VFVVQRNCPCCQKAAKLFQHLVEKYGIDNIPKEELIRAQFHCEDCWNKYHNGLRNGDWEDDETYLRKHSIKRRG